MRSGMFCFLIVAAVMVGGCAGVLNADLQRAKKTRQPIFIASIAAGRPDKHGFIDARAAMFNTSSKTYKYVDISVTAYNRVGDPIVREGDTSPVVRLRFTGPLRPRRTAGTSVWPKVWYVRKIACIAITQIDIEHMDGTSVAIEAAGLGDVLAAGLQKCGVAV